MRLPVWSTYRRTMDAIEVPDGAPVCVRLALPELGHALATEKGDMVKPDEIYVPLEALLDYISKPKLRKVSYR